MLVGEDMKKIFPVLLAVVVGGICALFLFKRVESVNSLVLDGNATAVQIGVFTKEENAKSMAIKYGGIVKKDEELFRVYYSVLSKEKNINYITKLLKEKGINYYLKRITLKESELEKLNKYESLMEKANNEMKSQVNSQMLKAYEESYE